MRKKLIVSVWAAAALLAPVCWAQAPEAATEPAAAAPPDRVLLMGDGPSVMPLGAGIHVMRGAGSIMGQVVKDKPYSAESITETVQVLADGNRITHTNSARVYRDGEGRTRLEQTLASLGPWHAAGAEPVTLVTVHDPVANRSYTLNTASSGTRTLHRTRSAHLEPQLRSIIRAAPAVPADASGADEHAAGVQGVHSAPHFIVAGPTGHVVTHPGPAPHDQGEHSTEDLGEQVLQGVLTRGTRHTLVIAAGAIGNERPIEIVTEQWYSPELEALVLRRTSDPRFGETHYQLVNVVLGEPPAHLFAPPEHRE